MHHETDICFIDTHAKGDGCHNDACFARHKAILNGSTVVVTKACMIRNSRIACCL